MTSSKSILATLAGILVKALSRESRAEPVEPRRPHATLRPDGVGSLPHARDAGREGGTATVRIDPESVPDLAVGYSPSRNRLPDSGEVIWTWVPYEENDGRGKDRPVLVIGRQTDDRVYAVRMTSRSRDGDRDYVPIGSGDWDSRGRESWVDIEQLYSVHADGMRREAAVLDAGRYGRVAEALIARYGWARA
ncbi:type II toxin-antitoxin system PemK/MazF family toxin [Microbacterium sp.]|uniref:type II toxin-antitoxin system PemK/MazF family toxin n=1 Tax=Microbacterium sp. TaxID=51671 RepID=UPI0028120BB5|nr:type II toxin-antitoxin system PemK/MazF family toxin [Microbacterium sp.]